MKNQHNFDKFIKKSKIIHDSFYNYEKVAYINARIKVIIICPVHGEFTQTPDNHTQGAGCPKCMADKLSRDRKRDVSEFIQRSHQVHNHKYEYDKFIYVNSFTKGVITCDTHGDFEQTPASHLKGAGCYHCGVITIKNKSRSTNEEFIKKAVNLHNGRYGYTKFIYINAATKGIIDCEEHGEFTQTPNSHLNGNGCPRCRESKGEKIIASILEDNNIPFVREYKLPGTTYRFKYDFYLPEYHLLIEFHGEQHYMSVKWFNGEEGLRKTKFRDAFKKELAKLANIPVIYFNFNHLKISRKEFEQHIFYMLDKRMKRKGT